MKVSENPDLSVDCMAIISGLFVSLMNDDSTLLLLGNNKMLRKDLEREKRSQRVRMCASITQGCG